MSKPNDVHLSDTSPEAEKLIYSLLAKKSIPEKAQMVCDMNQTVRDLAMAGLKTRHPADTPEQLKVRLADLLYGPAVAKIIADHLQIDLP
jgi:hypothetical protein